MPSFVNDTPSLAPSPFIRASPKLNHAQTMDNKPFLRFSLQKTDSPLKFQIIPLKPCDDQSVEESDDSVIVEASQISNQESETSSIESKSSKSSMKTNLSSLDSPKVNEMIEQMSPTRKFTKSSIRNLFSQT